MITVTIAINGRILIHRGAVNMSPDSLPDNAVHVYHSDDGSVIKHRRSDGCAKLAIEMLKRVKEVL